MNFFSIISISLYSQYYNTNFNLNSICYIQTNKDQSAQPDPDAFQPTHIFIPISQTLALRINYTRGQRNLVLQVKVNISCLEKSVALIGYKYAGALLTSYL